MKKVGIVDIGSNGIRFLVAEGNNYKNVQILFEERVSLRLGHDAFQTGHLSDETRWQFYQAMLKIRLLCQDLEVPNLRAVATSALRNSTNSKIVVSDVKRITGIPIELISGEKEAALLRKATDSALPRISATALAMDVGGGSTEFSSKKFGISLPLGTVRLLEKCVGRSFEDFALVIRPHLLRLRASMPQPHEFHNLIGTGGNLRSLARLSYRLHFSQSKNSFSVNAANALRKKLFDLSFDERRKKFKLDSDRADVILPAICLLVEACRIFKVRNIYAPNVGLKNGLLLDFMDDFLDK